MAKLYFHYSTMNAGKSTLLLQASYNYIERGMQTYLLTANFDDRAGKGQIGSRIGISAEADTYTQSEDLFDKIDTRLKAGPCPRPSLASGAGRGRSGCPGHVLRPPR